MKHNYLIDMQGQSLASLLNDDLMDSIVLSSSLPLSKEHRIRRFRPERENRSSRLSAR